MRWRGGPWRRRRAVVMGLSLTAVMGILVR